MLIRKAKYLFIGIIFGNIINYYHKKKRFRIFHNEIHKLNMPENKNPVKEKRILRDDIIKKIIELWKNAPFSFILPAAVLIISLTFTFFVWRYIREEVEKDLLASFNNRVQLSTDLIEKRINNYSDVLRSLRGFFNASESVERDEFKVYVESLQLEENYPGTQGLGFSIIIQPTELSRHIQNLRNEGFPEYAVKPAGNRNLYTSIVYLEPFAGRNLSAFGYDMFSEPVRHQAMELSRDLNRVVISGKVLLVQETDTQIQAGFLMYLPVFKHKAKIKTLADRKKNIIGWVYYPFRMKDLMSSVLGMNLKDVDIEIYDGDKINSSALMYDSNPELSHNLKSNFNKTIKLNLAEHVWTISINSSNELESQFNWRKPEYTASLFAICSFLFAALIFALVKGREKAIMLNKTKDKFFSIISHDLRSPYNGFLNLAEILATQPEVLTLEELKKLGGALYKSAQSQYRLLNDLLNWAKIQMDSFVLRPELLELKNEADSVIEFFETQLKQKNIVVLNKIDQNLKASFDRDMINLVFRNLISNSIKFVYAGGEIVITAVEKGNMVFVTVSDNGMGIEQRDLPKLFKIESRHSTTGTFNEKGTGLGLTLCKEIIERHNGKITVESEKGKGTAFTFSLPVN
jgi:signal transduction histidine kinase